MKKKNTAKYLIYFMFCACIVLFFIAFFREKRLENNSLYTIGVPVKTWYIKFNYKYDYFYQINGKRYESRSGYTDLKPNDVLGKNFYVQFEEGNPSNSKILFDKPVLDTTIKVPPGGLKYIYEYPR